jgi:starch synthase
VKVLFATVEMSPLAKVGGLADVAGSLPKALVRAGHDVRVIMPRHGNIAPDALGFKPYSAFHVGVTGGDTLSGTVLQGEVAGVPVYLIDVPELFARTQVYGEPDDLERWVAFCDAALDWLAQDSWQPDVLHLNEWHTAFMGSRLRCQPHSRLAPIPRVYTVHNLAIHGGFDDDFARAACLEERVLESPLAPEKWMLHSGMGQGLAWSDVINTVSPTYAREILTPEYGAGFDPLLNARRDQLFGILNGIDYEEFDPATDTRLPAHYDARDFSGHAENKRALQARLGLREDSNTPLIGIVTRLFYQKGADLAVEAIERLIERRPVQLAVLGTGDQAYHDQLIALRDRHPGNIAVTLAFDADLAQLIYGGSDLFLMPSRFEPCGLGQMIALRYGSVPVVRRTGGLADTVEEWSPSSGTGNGFVFDEATAAELEAALDRALDTFEKPDEWRQLVAQGMAGDYSWGNAAQEYVKLYQRAQQAATDGSGPARAE